MSNATEAASQLEEQTNRTINAIACYSLPYGGLGFTSHMLTFYTIVCLFFGHKPLWPCSRLKYRGWNLFVGMSQLIGTTITTVLNICSCLGEWQFVALGSWMLSTSVVLSMLTMWMPYFYRPRTPPEDMGCDGPGGVELGRPTMGTYYNVRGELLHYPEPLPPLQDMCRRPTPKVPGWRIAIMRSRAAKSLLALLLLLWFTGCAFGIVAIVQVSRWRYSWEMTYQGLGPMYIVTCVFAGLSFLPLASSWLKSCINGNGVIPWPFGSLNPVDLGWGILCSAPFVCVFALLWMDWALGIVTGNLVGQPPEDTKLKAMYSAYFAAKRLPLFSF